MAKRISTLSFGRRALAHLDNASKASEALEHAMVADILTTMDAHDGARFFVLGCYQSFKSFLGQLRLARNHWIRPRPAGWYAPTIDFAKKFADEKLNPLLEALPDLQLITKKSSKLYWKFNNGSHHLLSINTENDRTGATYCDIYFDEPHLYEPGWIEQASNRRGAYTESQEFTETFMSTGLTEGEGAVGSEAVVIWKSTDQRTWHVRCPACKKFFEPRYIHREKPDDDESPIIGGIIYKKAFDADGLPDRNAIADTLHHQCPKCRAVLPDSQGSRLALSGTIHKPIGIYACQNANAHPRTFGWTFPALAIRPWIDTVLKFEKALIAMKRGDLELMGKWVREEMAGIWIPEKYLRKRKSRPQGDYRMGEEWPEEALDPEGRPVRALTCDVQMDHFVPLIRMWSKDGRSRLRYVEKCTTPSRVRDLAMQHKVISERVFLDARHEPEYVRRTCTAFGWRAFLGEKDKDYLHTSNHTRRIYSEPRWINAYQGTAHAAAYCAQINFAKQSALSRLHLIRSLPARGPGEPQPFSAAQDAPDWYFTELDAHYRVKQTTPEGQIYWVWHGHHDDHSADDEAMQVVFASMAGLIGAESLETVATDQPKAA